MISNTAKITILIRSEEKSIKYSLKKCSRGGLRKRGIAAREALKEEERAEKSAQICRRIAESGLFLSYIPAGFRAAEETAKRLGAKHLHLPVC